MCTIPMCRDKSSFSINDRFEVIKIIHFSSMLLSKLSFPLASVIDSLILRGTQPLLLSLPLLDDAHTLARVVAEGKLEVFSKIEDHFLSFGLQCTYVSEGHSAHGSMRSANAPCQRCADINVQLFVPRFSERVRMAIVTKADRSRE